MEPINVANSGRSDPVVIDGRLSHPFAGDVARNSHGRIGGTPFSHLARTKLGGHGKGQVSLGANPVPSNGL